VGLSPKALAKIFFWLKVFRSHLAVLDVAVLAFGARQRTNIWCSPSSACGRSDQVRGETIFPRIAP
jgi:hypothetical protein